MKRVAVILATLVLCTGLAWAGTITEEEFQRQFLDGQADAAFQRKVQASASLQLFPEVLKAEHKPIAWELWRYHIESATWGFTGYAFKPVGHCIGSLRALRVISMDEGWGRVYQCRPGYATRTPPPMRNW